MPKRRADGGPAARSIARRKTEVINDWGLHARPSAIVAKTAGRFASEITIHYQDRSASASAISSLLMLEAAKGAQLVVEAVGPDARQAAKEVAEVFDQGFGEEHVVLKGKGSSWGTVVGVAHVYRNRPDDVPHYQITEAGVKAECQRLRDALKAQREEFRKAKTAADNQVVKDFQNLLLGMLKEGHFSRLPFAVIERELTNAEWALKVSVKEITDQFHSLDNPLWRSKAEEYNQLLAKLVGRLQGGKGQRGQRRKPGSRRIVVALDAGPTDVLDFNKAGYAGFVTSGGSANSHAAILARGLGMAAIVALDHDALEEIEEDDQLALDSDSSELHVRPGKAALARLRAQARVDVDTTKRTKVTRRPRKQTGHVRTRDGVRIDLMANIEFLTDIEPTLRFGAGGVGLFRTEFLFIREGKAPSEDDQYDHYREVVKGLGGKPVTFRTLDLGHDKMFQGVQDSPLGFRGIRYNLKEVEIFKTQARALLRAAREGPLKIMLPMVGQVAEMRDARNLIVEAADEIGLSQGELPEIGAMVEIPGTIFILGGLAPNCDFFSIGTNDLIQYTLAVDRNIATLATLANPCHPGVISLLERAIRVSLKLGKPLTMCGELAADMDMVRLCTTLGLRELSMNPARLEEMREMLAGFSIKASLARAQKIVRSESLDEVQTLMNALAGRG